MPELITSSLDSSDFTAILARIALKLHPDLPPPTQEEQAASRTAAWARYATILGIPTRLHNASLSTSTPTLAIIRTSIFIATEAPRGRCLVLCGSTGTGKSWAAAAALRRFHPPLSTFFYWPELCAKLLQSSDRAAALAAATAPGLIVFDDLGAEYYKENGFLAAQVDSILWRRHANIFPTIITTNLSPEELRERFSDRIIDRLLPEWTSIYELTHESLRSNTPQ